MTGDEKGYRLSYKFRLYPNEAQKHYFAVNFGCTRFVYNHFLDARIKAYEATKKELCDGFPNPAYDPKAKPMTFFDTSRALTVLKKDTVDDEGHRWLYDADAIALVYSLRHLDAAYKNFFRRVKNGDAKAGFPKFKSRYDSEQSFTTAKCEVGDGYVTLAKVGRVKARTHRAVEGEFVSATISKNPAGQYHIAVNVKGVEKSPMPEAHGAVGITMGVERWIVTSDGEVIDSPEASKKLEKKLAREQRRLSRRVGARKGEHPSKNYQKQKLKVARVQNRIRNMRANATHNATRHLVDEHRAIFSRDMGSQSMAQGARAKSWKLNRAIADANFAEINRQLAYKAQWAGRDFVLLPKETPTAQVCVACGHKEPSVAKHLNQEWVCPVCGHVHDRKYNGARNVLAAGLDVLNGSTNAPVTKALEENLKRKAARKNEHDEEV